MSQIFINVVGSSIVLVTAAMIYALMLLDEKKIKFNIKNILIFIITICIYSLIGYYLDGTLKTLMLCVLYVIFFKYMFDTSYFISIILSLTNIVIMIVPDTIVVLFIIGVLKIPPETFYNVYSCTIYPTLAVNILFIAITFIFKRWLRKIVSIKVSNKLEIISCYTLTLVSIIIIFYNAYNNIEVISRNLFISSAIMVVLH